MIDYGTPIPTDRDALAAERLRLVERGSEINAAMPRLQKADPKRAVLVGEKTTLDARLKRVNVALAHANRVASDAGLMPAQVAQRSVLGTAPASPPAREAERTRDVLRVACALLSGPLASDYSNEDGDLRIDDLLDDAHDVVVRAFGEDAPAFGSDGGAA
jgi:hypothetical protein